MAGRLELLKDFEFNKYSHLRCLILRPLFSQIDPDQRKAVLEIPELRPATDFKWPENADSVQIYSLLASVNFDEEKAEEHRAVSGKISRTAKTIPSFQLETRVECTDNRVLIHCVAIRFYFKHSDLRCMNRYFNGVSVYDVEMGI